MEPSYQGVGGGGDGESRLVERELDMGGVGGSGGGVGGGLGPVESGLRGMLDRYPKGRTSDEEGRGVSGRVRGGDGESRPVGRELGALSDEGGGMGGIGGGFGESGPKESDFRWSSGEDEELRRKNAGRWGDPMSDVGGRVGDGGDIFDDRFGWWF